MTNQIAIALGLAFAVLIGFDTVANDGENLLFLAKKFADLIEWLAFWR